MPHRLPGAARRDDVREARPEPVTNGMAEFVALVVVQCPAGSEFPGKGQASGPPADSRYRARPRAREQRDHEQADRPVPEHEGAAQIPRCEPSHGAHTDRQRLD